jgi:16S rRNA (guanine527-N7)-methyltransferase
MFHVKPSPAPTAPPVATAVFGDRLELAQRYADLLASEATVRGLIGPREVDRLWERHLLNCAVVTDVVPPDASVCDVGSGAGLPGLVMAIRRPDLAVTLLEPLLRRTTFLEEAVLELGLAGVHVVRGRAEAVTGLGLFDVVTSRAVAPMDRLSRWSLPLARSGGQFLAMKGSSVHTELESAAPVIRRLGGAAAEVVELGRGVVEPRVRVVRVVKG